MTSIMLQGKAMQTIEMPQQTQQIDFVQPVQCWSRATGCQHERLKVERILEKFEIQAGNLQVVGSHKHLHKHQ